jgi:hypothetical protein
MSKITEPKETDPRTTLLQSIQRLAQAQIAPQEVLVLLLQPLRL